MIKFLIKYILITGLAFGGLYILPWWIVLVSAIIVNLIIKSKGVSVFLVSFLGCFTAWFLQSYIIYETINKDFVDAIGGLFFIPKNGFLFILACSGVIALIGALAGYTANAFRNLIIKPKKDSKSKYGKPNYSRYR